jgi:hypothetical protein
MADARIVDATKCHFKIFDSTSIKRCLSVQYTGSRVMMVVENKLQDFLECFG